ncbi:hypothetical protein ACFY2H_32350 [Streptomyces griseofuscus]|uniref:hypothetical protein n=1 Tax=Streptomyces griseofuscus TaxID=146922 RepID=UPI0036963053
MTSHTTPSVPVVDLTPEQVADQANATCGNRWKYGKDMCARDYGHIGPHRNTEALEAWSFHWFDNEGTPAPAPATTAGALPRTVTHASGLTFKVIPGDSHFARVARGIRKLTMADGTEWTVGTPVGWRGMPAAWQEHETPQERDTRLHLYGESIRRRDRIQFGLRIESGRRLVAAGIISRRIDVRITEAGVTGTIRKGARR